MVSRLKEATIIYGTAKYDKVRDVVSPHLVRTCERLPIVLQGPVRELASGRPVTELTLDGIRTVGIGFLERIEALLDHNQDRRDAIADDSGDEAEDGITSTSLCSISPRASRRSFIPRIIPIYRLRTFAVQLSKSATLKVTVVCMQDTASAVMKRLRVQDARQLLDRAQLAERESEDVVTRSPTTALATRVAKKGCERLLGEWLTSAILGRVLGTERQQQPTASVTIHEEIQLELFEVKQPGEAQIEEFDSDEEGHGGGGASSSSSKVEGTPTSTGESPSHGRIDDALGITHTGSQGSVADPMEFRLIVKNSFIEFDEPAGEPMRRAHSWESMRSLGRHRNVSSEPFTVLATMEPLTASPGASPMMASNSSPPSFGTIPSTSQPAPIACSRAASSTDPHTSCPNPCCAPVAAHQQPTAATAGPTESDPVATRSDPCWSVSAAVSAFGPPQSPVTRKTSAHGPVAKPTQPVQDPTALPHAGLHSAVAPAASPFQVPQASGPITPVLAPWPVSVGLEQSSGVQVAMAASSSTAVDNGVEATMAPSSSAAVACLPVALPETMEECRTTVMLRNIPTGYSRAELLGLLERRGFSPICNFVYVPVDFTRNIGLGYALVCTETTMDAHMILQDFNGLVDWGAPQHGTCPCEASWSEPRQGLQEHIDRYRNSPVMHKSVQDEYKPVLFEGGKRIVFPPPTKAIRAPRIRHLKPTQ